MKKGNLRAIIILMSVALLGLIILQFYWIKISIDVNHERFRNNVQAALDNVVNKLEKEEALYVAKQQFASSFKIEDDYFLLDFDSLGNARWKEGQTIKFRQEIESPQMKEEGIAYEVEEEAVISRSGFARKKVSGIKSEAPNRLGSQTLPMSNWLDSAQWYRQVIQQRKTKITNLADMVSGIVTELVSKNKDIYSRIDRSQLDTLLRQEFEVVGIDIPFDYAVMQKEPGMKNVIFTNNPNKTYKVAKSGFYTKLFPSDLLDTNHLLYVNFPDQSAYVLREMWLVLGSSTVFISLIIFCFGFAVFTIIRQKKISEITNDFISNMTHELKTPISTVSLATEALLDPDIRSIESQSNRYLNIIKEENGRLAMQVEKVLQTARMDRGDFKLKKVPVNIHDAINKALKNIAIQIEQRRGAIHTYLEAEKPVIEADELHITNIIYNLLDNANKYSPETPDITIRTLNTKMGIKLFIADKGQGISKETISKVFDKFYRVPTGNVHNVKGFGLGLSYVKTMVEAHQGDISVRSEPNKGSVFTIFLPYKNE